MGVHISTHVWRCPACPCPFALAVPGRVSAQRGFGRGQADASPFPPPRESAAFSWVGAAPSATGTSRASTASGQRLCFLSARRPGGCPRARTGHFWKHSRHSGDGEGAILCHCNARTSYMALNGHKPLHCAGNGGVVVVVEAPQLPTQVVIPNNATNEALGLNDLLQPPRKALSVPVAEGRGGFGFFWCSCSVWLREEKSKIAGALDLMLYGCQGV